jgi:predicted choloylglycine hydrolase
MNRQQPIWWRWGISRSSERDAPSRKRNPPPSPPRSPAHAGGKPEPEGSTSVYFSSVDELEPGSKWAALFARFWPAYRNWYLKEGDAARPGFITCRRALREHMPELEPTWEKLVDLAGGGDMAARFLSLYRPPPFLTACSQGVWRGKAPALVRNYDYDPKLCEGITLRSMWHDREVIAMSDCMWGALDGINDAGLAASLAFGGRRVVGDGFGMPLILRYVLEVCENTEEAIRVLKRVPTHMAYNVTVVDRRGAFATLFLSPDRTPIVTRRPLATNHQRRVDWKEYAGATASLERERFLGERLEDRSETLDSLVQRFLQAPLYSARFQQGWGTLYTALYRTADLSAEFLWPGGSITQTFDDFRETTVRVDFPKE